VLAALGLALTHHMFRPAYRRWAVVSFFVGAALLLLGGAVVGVAFAREDAALCVLGIAIAGAGLLPLSGGLMAVGSKGSRWWVGGGMALVVTGIILAVGVNVRWAVSALLVVLGFIAFRIGIRPVIESSKRNLRWATGLGAASTILGVTLLLAGAFRPSSSVFLLGVAILVLGLVPFSVGWPSLALRPITPSWALVIGSAALVIGFVFWPKGVPGWLPWVAGGLLAVVGASFVLRGEGFLAVVLIGFVLVWVLVNRTDDARLDPNPGATERILSLGDSYSSGEGATAFFPGTNVVGEHQNQCRRSSTAYPYLVASSLGMGLDFFACSGAVTREIYAEGQMDERSPDDIAGELPQLDNLGGDFSRIRAVLISIGGNDAGFGAIGKACVSPGTCTAFRENWLVNVARIGPDITDAFEAIRERVGSSTPVVAIPYPVMLTETGCSWSALNRGEHDFLDEYVTVLNDRVRTSAEEAGVNFFGPGLLAFDNARICEGEGPDDTAMNFFNAHPTQGDFIDRINPTNWVHGTFHPKPSGHQLIANALTPWLEKLLGDVDAGLRPANPEPDPSAVFQIPTVSTLETVLTKTGDIPREIDCPIGEVSSFATLLPVIDAATSFQLNASNDAPLCHTAADGSWTSDETGIARDQNGVTIQPELPEEGWTQRFIYKTSGPSGRWQLRIVEFCNRKPGCPTDVSQWIGEQLVSAAQAVVLPSVFLFFGGWMLSLGLMGFSRVGTLRWAKETNGRLRFHDRVSLILGQGVPTWIERAGRASSVRLDLAELRPLVPYVQENIPTTAIAQTAEDMCRESGGDWLVAHCYRSFAYGALFGSSLPFDRDVFFVACMLHDIELSRNGMVNPRIAGREDFHDTPCFAVRGAMVARDLASDHDWPPEKRDSLAEAVSLHVNVRVRPSQGLEAHLLNVGSALDVLGLRVEMLPESAMEVIEQEWPRDDGFCNRMWNAWSQEGTAHKDCRGYFLVRWGSFERRLFKTCEETGERSSFPTRLSAG
jgi:lysophospholipase L1-like esterase